MAFIGIDVSKDKLDVLWLRQSAPLKVKTRVFRNHRPVMTQTNVRVMASIEDMIRALKEEIRKLKSDIDQHINGHPELKQDRELLQTIPGVAEVCSVQLLSVLRSRDFGSARECAAFVGLVPVHTQSGSTLRKQSRISKAGRSSTMALQLFSKLELQLQWGITCTSKNINGKCHIQPALPCEDVVRSEALSRFEQSNWISAFSHSSCLARVLRSSGWRTLAKSR